MNILFLTVISTWPKEISIYEQLWSMLKLICMLMMISELHQVAVAKTTKFRQLATWLYMHGQFLLLHYLGMFTSVQLGWNEGIFTLLSKCLEFFTEYLSQRLVCLLTGIACLSLKLIALLGIVDLLSWSNNLHWAKV